MRARTSRLPFWKPSPGWTWVTVITLAVVNLALDVSTPPGVTTELLYLLVVLLALRHPSSRAPWVCAVLCTVLVVVGYILSPPHAAPVADVSSRALTILLMWGTAALATAGKRSTVPIRLAVQKAPNAVLIVDQEGSIAFANAQAEGLLGYRVSELEGLPLEDLVPERFKSEHVDQRRRFMKHPETRLMGGRDLSAIRKNGSEIPVEIGLSHFRAYGRMFAVASMVDIAERKRNEQAMYAQNRELQTLLHAISHDLKEPLRGIEGFGRLLDERHSERLDEEGRRLLTRTRGAAARLRRLLDDLMTLSGARHGRADRSPVDVRRLTEDALDRLEEAIDGAGARVEIIGDLPCLAVDPTWAREAIFNLVSNALKFTRSGDRADIEIEGFHSSEGGGVVVRDRGPGVAPGDAERIFEPLQRAHCRQTEGTGAGLAIVRAVAERHEGRAWVQPRVGGGSEFFITFGPTSITDTSLTLHSHHEEQTAPVSTWELAHSPERRRALE